MPLLKELFSDVSELSYVSALPFSKSDDYELDYFLNNDVEVLKEYLANPISRNGSASDVLVGKIHNIYFYLIVDPGISGYECCGQINLWYTTELHHFRKQLPRLNNYFSDESELPTI